MWVETDKRTIRPQQLRHRSLREAGVLWVAILLVLLPAVTVGVFHSFVFLFLLFSD